MRSVEIIIAGVGIWVRGAVCRMVRIRCWVALGGLEVKPRLGLRIWVLLLIVILPGSKRRIIPALLTRGLSVCQMSVIVVVVIVPRFL